MFFKLKPFPNDKFSLTGFVGPDGTLYWKARDVGIMLNYAAPSQFALYYRPHLHVKDLINRVLFSPRVMNTRVLDTEQMLNVVRNRRAGAYLNLANKLESLISTGRVARDENAVTSEGCFPTLIVSDDENMELFQSWLKCFAQDAILFYGEYVLNPDESPLTDSQACCSQSSEINEEDTVEMEKKSSSAENSHAEATTKERLWESSNEGRLIVMSQRAMETTQGEMFPVADHIVLDGQNGKYIYKLSELKVSSVENP